MNPVSPRHIKTPPLLLLAAMTFWGWQSDLLVIGLGMGIVLELPQMVKIRWDLAAADFRRVWNFCTLLALLLVVYVFAANSEGGGAGNLLHESNLETTRHVGVSANTFLRWLPMTFFLVIAAQMFSESESIPPSAISMFMHRKRAASTTPERNIDISYPYFMVCLFSAGIHNNDGGQAYFWGQVGLVAWALWPFRSRRFSTLTWLCAVIVVLGLGFVGQRAIGEVQRILGGYNARWLAGFFHQQTDPTKSFTAIGQVGRLKLSPRIVIRLEPRKGSPVPTYLREATYRSYRPQTRSWASGGTQNDFYSLSADRNSNESAWTLSPDKTNHLEQQSVVTIASYLEGHSAETGYPEGLLPLPIDASHLEKLPVFSLRTNQTGAVLALGLGLVIFDAHYGVQTTFDSPPSSGTNTSDIYVPTNELPAVRKIVSQSGLVNASYQQKIAFVRDFFAANFRYSDYQSMDVAALTNQSPLAYFLLESHRGHCEYFASATVLLLRQLKIPARYAVGYYVHEKSGHGYVVRERDAHAWCLVWNPEVNGWQNFDTTSSEWVGDEEKRAPATEWLSDFFSWVRFQFAKLWWGQQNIRIYILWGLVPVLIYLFYQMVFRRGRKSNRRVKNKNDSKPSVWPGMDSEFFLLERRLAALGIERLPGENLSHWLERILSGPELTELRRKTDRLLPLHYRHRFDPVGLNGSERAALKAEVAACLEQLAKAKGR